MAGGSVSQIVVEACVQTDGSIAVSQVVVEAYSQYNLAPVRVGQVVLQALTSYNPGVRCSQIFIEALIPFVELTVATYPTLIGLTYSVHKRPVWSTGVGKAASGRSVRVGYFSYNSWEWELQYDYLPDYVGAGTTASDYKTLQAFFLQTSGALLPFQFRDPDDNTVTAGVVGTTDGTTTTWTIGRHYDANANCPYEPIGMINTATPINVYLNGTLQSPSTYTIQTNTPVNQQLTFHTAPTAGETITMDFQFYFWVTFKEDTLDFEKFVNLLWQNESILLVSQKD